MPSSSLATAGFEVVVVVLESFFSLLFCVAAGVGPFLPAAFDRDL